MKAIHSTSYEKRFKSPQWREGVVCPYYRIYLFHHILFTFYKYSKNSTPLLLLSTTHWYNHSLILPCRPLNEMTSRHSSLPYFQQQQPLAGPMAHQPTTSSFLSPNSTAAPDHVPLTMRDDTNGFTTGTTRSSDSFRQRHFKKPNEVDDPFDDVDLSMDYDSKVFKARQRRAIAESKARKRDWRISLALTVWALYIRLWRISQPSSVV